ncbi:hypothetical protein BV898_16294 [Hypsibius exemplaris]|uniref:Uncharacterized protein n=1 Tax=Hypsibius exemplaris TaxID=2072580 RepID=A0A9X6RLN9_HYPEX|nr:hypothetical protein BV898_16294 [Hypsibius exemplaris]
MIQACEWSGASSSDFSRPLVKSFALSDLKYRPLEGKVNFLEERYFIFGLNRRRAAARKFEEESAEQRRRRLRSTWKATATPVITNVNAARIA